MAWTLILLSGSILGLEFPERQESSAVLKSEFIFETAPFAQGHASTIAETGADSSRPGSAGHPKE